MGKDKEFKSTIKIKDFTFVKLNDLGDFYNPDATFTKDATILFFESSSTSDRKVHIGELIQFLTYVVNNETYKEFYFILNICCESTNPPKVSDEIKRLQYYYDSFSLTKKKRDSIKKIAILEKNDNYFENLTIENILQLDGLEL